MLPTELWAIVDNCLHLRDRWSLVGVCKESRDAVHLNCKLRNCLNAEQATAWLRVVVLGQSVFLTGGAGVGKTFTLRAIASAILEEIAIGNDAVSIVSPTGAAARLASTDRIVAKTVHLMFNIRRRKRTLDSKPVVFQEGVASMNQTEDDYEDDYEDEECGLETAVLDVHTLRRLRALRLLIIDEVSMLSGSMLELMDEALRVAHSSKASFGGCSILAVGDFYQLAPVTKNSETKVWAFDSTCWSFLKPIQLTQVVRQSNQKFAEVLNRMRIGMCTMDDAAWINASTRKVGEGQLSLFPSNIKCRQRNKQMLSGLHGAAATYSCTKYCIERTCTEPWTTVVIPNEHLPKPARYSSAVEETLHIKEGCRVRCTKNIYTGTYPERDLIVANGQRGTVLSLGHDVFDEVCVLVHWDSMGSREPEETVIKAVSWSRRQKFNSREGKPIYAITKQLPLAAAFAITLHAAQGGSIDSNYDVDHRGFEPDARGNWVTKPASAYVALSRATDVLNIRLLRRFRCSDAVVHDAVTRYYKGVFGQ